MKLTGPHPQKKTGRKRKPSTEALLDKLAPNQSRLFFGKKKPLSQVEDVPTTPSSPVTPETNSEQSSDQIEGLNNMIDILIRDNAEMHLGMLYWKQQYFQLLEQQIAPSAQSYPLEEDVDSLLNPLYKQFLKNKAQEVITPPPTSSPRSTPNRF